MSAACRAAPRNTRSGLTARDASTARSLTPGARSARLGPMLDIVIANGTVVTSEGAGAWEVGIQGERIAAVGLPGSLPREGARVIDAAGRIVVPGGIDPHTHLAHAIMSHPDQPSATLGPEDDTRGMAWGGTTTHIDFVYVRPGRDDIQAA